MYGISIDIGTSGTRMHAIDLDSGQILSTAMTVRHPVPGANVMDHLTFCIEVDQNLANHLMVDTINRLIDLLGIDKTQVGRIAVCGNPIQLSIFQNMEIRDLAFAGERALKVRGVEHQKRDAKVLASDKIGIDLGGKNTDVYIPPSIKHEIGADALAMMYKTGLLERKETCLVTDYGTNAEMALKVGDDIFTGSAAAGPAMEGQSVHFGMLASPGAITDVDVDNYWRCSVLDDTILPQQGDLVEVNTGNVVEEGKMHGMAKGITGTGVVAAIAAGIEWGTIQPPRFTTMDGKIHLQDGVFLDPKDFLEASKAFGAMRAGHFTLLEHAGVKFDDLDTMYMSGASGTYVDALKAQKVGLIPATPKTIYQVGNTSLACATDIVRDPQMMDKLQTIANSIRANHIMFAMDKVFETIYLQELGMWQEGMTRDMYNFFLDAKGIQPLPEKFREAKVHRIVERDIPVVGAAGLKILRDIGTTIVGAFERCIGCRKCEEECPENAISIEDARDEFKISVRSDLCNGTACLRCERICPEKVFVFKQLKIGGKS
ncbi:MAG: formate hydrogenlyase complex iron-sulfur subunit [Methanomassiliicoccales archaeon PtaU1.Bin124]|nr:MAG: formate hydrogenlyase complex iron-sulfur subunit [Methanomassiliicoccales archaeon PtaU1.Bin124]